MHHAVDETYRAYNMERVEPEYARIPLMNL